MLVAVPALSPASGLDDAGIAGAGPRGRTESPQAHCTVPKLVADLAIERYLNDAVPQNARANAAALCRFPTLGYALADAQPPNSSRLKPGIP